MGTTANFNGEPPKPKYTLVDILLLIGISVYFIVLFYFCI